MNQDLKHQTARQFREFIFGESEPLDFDGWLCRTSELEGLIGSEKYFELINLNYKDKDQIEQGKENASRLYRDVLGEHLEKDRARDALNELLDGSRAPLDACNILSELRTAGADFIPAVFDGYASELTNAEHLTHYRERLIADAQALLKSLTDK